MNSGSELTRGCLSYTEFRDGMGCFLNPHKPTSVSPLEMPLPGCWWPAPQTSQLIALCLLGAEGLLASLFYSVRCVLLCLRKLWASSLWPQATFVLTNMSQAPICIPPHSGMPPKGSLYLGMVWRVAGLSNSGSHRREYFHTSSLPYPPNTLRSTRNEKAQCLWMPPL